MWLGLLISRNHVRLADWRDHVGVLWCSSQAVGSRTDSHQAVLSASHDQIAFFERPENPRR
jgi:hypothetical protein